jgi:hypothetical protein
MALRRPSFIWNRERVVIAELLLCSDAPRTAMSVARALRLQRVNALGSLGRMEKEGFVEADRPYDPDLLGTERTFTVAPGTRAYVQERVSRFRQRYPLQQWYVEIQVPSTPLSAEEEQALRQAMPKLIRFKQPPEQWLTVVMKVATEHRYDAFDAAYDEFVEAWEHTLERGSLPNFGVSHTASWEDSAKPAEDEG